MKTKILVIIFLILGLTFAFCEPNDTGDTGDTGDSGSTAITFPDANLEQVIREKINKPTGDIYPEDVIGITELEASEKGIVDLTGLEYLINLTYLDLSENTISNINALS